MTNIQHVDSDLKGGVIERQRSEIQVVLDFAGIDDDGLAQEFDGTRRVSEFLRRVGGDVEGSGIRFGLPEKRIQGSKRVARLVISRGHSSWLRK